MTDNTVGMQCRDESQQHDLVLRREKKMEERWREIERRVSYAERFRH